MKIKELLDEAIFALSDQNYNKSIAYSLLSIATKLNEDNTTDRPKGRNFDVVISEEEKKAKAERRQKERERLEKEKERNVINKQLKGMCVDVNSVSLGDFLQNEKDHPPQARMEKIYQNVMKEQMEQEQIELLKTHNTYKKMFEFHNASNPKWYKAEDEDYYKNEVQEEDTKWSQLEFDFGYEENCNSPLDCNHANEVPYKCNCGTGCYCKSNTCKKR